ncbi:polynucleotidyl transferase, partial [Striga asiatica]
MSASATPFSTANWIPSWFIICFDSILLFSSFLQYLKQNDFMEVASKTTDSYTWRSILKGRDILTKGVGICLANGKTTKFWFDDWSNFCPLIQYAKVEISEEEAEKCVAEYCNENGNWDLTRLQDCLPDEIVKRVASIWIDANDHSDEEVYWKLTSSGEFSTKSAYASQFAELSSQNSHLNLIWKLNCPNKIQMLVWRLLHGTLPTASYLSHRHLTNQVACFRCSSYVEDITHALRDCPKTKQTWLSLDNQLTQGRNYQLDSQSWILQNCKQKHLNLSIPWYLIFLYALWCMWYCRNCELHDKDFVSPGNAAQLIRGKAKEAHDVLNSFNSRLKHIAMISWVMPQDRTIKVNVDGSVKSQNGEATAAGIIRDSQATWLGGFVHRIGIAQVLESELWSIYDGLLLCWNKGFRRVELETDSLEAVKMISSLRFMGHPQHGIIKAIMELLDRSWICSISHIHREANSCADWLATHHDEMQLDFLELRQPPSSLIPLLVADTI